MGSCCNLKVCFMKGPSELQKNLRGEVKWAPQKFKKSKFLTLSNLHTSNLSLIYQILSLVYSCVYYDITNWAACYTKLHPNWQHIILKLLGMGKHNNIPPPHIIRFQNPIYRFYILPSSASTSPEVSLVLHSSTPPNQQQPHQNLKPN